MPRLCAASSSAPVAQLDRVPDYESGGRRFESFRVRHKKGLPAKAVPFLLFGVAGSGSAVTAS
ncbi:hypothetical protein ERY430_80032 [Erythrobacter sp. EC-HK427]|nr:hypothetical protein ERY430_80032 [Erythrobacter sp. EC-HK427]